MVHVPSAASLSFPLSVIFFFLKPASSRPSIWDVDIDNRPAPSPQDGPPISANAVRDKAYLPFQLVGIFGAYIVTIIFVAVALLTLGRRLRRSAQTSPRTLAMEIIRPKSILTGDNRTNRAFRPTALASPIKDNAVFGPSPISPAKTSNFWSSPKVGSGWGSLKNGKQHSRQQSMQSSVLTFDESVIEEDKSRNEFEMDRLYAAVAEHETAKDEGAAAVAPAAAPTDQRPPELQHLRHGPRLSPHTLPQPARHDAVPPSHIFAASPHADAARSARLARHSKKPSPISIQPSAHSSNASLASTARTRSVRHFPISPPMGSPGIAPYANEQYSDVEPLSPRHYAPGPPPTPPTQRQPAGPQRHGRRDPHALALASPADSDAPSPRRFYFAPSIRSSRNSTAPGPRSPNLSSPITEDGNGGDDDDDDDARPSFALTVDPAPPHPPTPAKSRKPTPLALPAGPGSSSSTTLPLRSTALPLRSLASAASTRPQSTIRATVLDRPGRNLRAPGTAGLVPSTPYSPFYMPQTPLTPMTPSRLVSREERRRRERDEGRRVLTAEDAVVEEGDMWGDAYA